MTNNTINVPRELLENIVLCYNEGEFELGTLAAECHALLSAPSPAGVDGLEVVAWQLGCQTMTGEIGWKLSWNQSGAGVCARLKGDEYEQPLCRLSDAQAIIDGLRGEVGDLHATMMAAAVEIQEHWAAHCDEEGYGPANLMHRLERGIASQYGYSAETLVRLESQRDQQAQRIGELEGLLLEALADKGRLDRIVMHGLSVSAQLKSGDFCGPKGHEWSVFKYGKGFRIHGETLREAIDKASAALSAGKEGSDEYVP